MKDTIEYESKALILSYMEIVVWASFICLLFPLIFLLSNLGEIPYAIWLIGSAFALIILTENMNLLITGNVFPLIPSKYVRLIIYMWGLILLILAACLVYCTGGVQSSIFVWLFEYALIVALLVRPKHEQTFFRRWRPVLLIVGIEILIITMLIIFGECSIPISGEIYGSMHIWGGFSIVSSIIAGIFLFRISDLLVKKRCPDKDKKCIN